MYCGTGEIWIDTKLANLGIMGDSIFHSIYMQIILRVTRVISELNALWFLSLRMFIPSKLVSAFYRIYMSVFESVKFGVTSTAQSYVHATIRTLLILYED